MEFRNLHIGEEIRRLIQSRKINIKTLAARSGRSPRAVSYSMKSRELSLRIIRSYSRALETDLFLYFLSKESYAQYLEGLRAEELEEQVSELRRQLEAAETEAVKREEAYSGLQARFEALEKENQALRYEAEKQKALADSLRDVIATLRA